LIFFAAKEKPKLLMFATEPRFCDCPAFATRDATRVKNRSGYIQYTPPDRIFYIYFYFKNDFFKE